jgi:ABC-type branched-subunit amino acid transport system substrate-binding protein
MSLRPFRGFFVAGVLPVLVLGLAACGEKAETGSARASPGIDPQNKVITVGMLNDESGPVAAIGRPWAVGKRIVARQINAGGSGFLPEGWTVEFIERDHGYNPQRSVQLFNEIRDRVLFIGTSFGTPNTLPLRPLLARNRIVAFPASLSSKMYEFEYTPPLAPSYKIETLRGLDWAIEQAGGADKLRLGLVYQHDDYGLDGLEAVNEAAEKLGIQVVSRQTYAAGQPDYTAVVSALKQAGATHVILTAVPSATGPILGIARQLDYSPVWVGNSPSWIDRFFDPTVVPPGIFENYHWISSVAYWGEKVPFMKGFLEAYEKYGRAMAAPDFYILASYSSGVTQMEVARRMIESGDLSREGYLKALRTLDDYDPQGMLPDPPDFSRLPYLVGTKSRVLKPDFQKRSWKVVGDYAVPSMLSLPPASN